MLHAKHLVDNVDFVLEHAPSEQIPRRVKRKLDDFMNEHGTGNFAIAVNNGWIPKDFLGKCVKLMKGNA